MEISFSLWITKGSLIKGGTTFLPTRIGTHIHRPAWTTHLSPSPEVVPLVDERTLFDSAGMAMAGSRWLRWPGRGLAHIKGADVPTPQVQGLPVPGQTVNGRQKVRTGQSQTEDVEVRNSRLPSSSKLRDLLTAPFCDIVESQTLHRQTSGA